MKFIYVGKLVIAYAWSTTLAFRLTWGRTHSGIPIGCLFIGTFNLTFAWCEVSP